jgi:glycosyltransferase involved in cell wall biosynthesis
MAGAVAVGPRHLRTSVARLNATPHGNFAEPSWGFVLRFLFDLTTSAYWEGPAVGITRVEEGLGRRAREHLGDDLVFCIYDKYRNIFLSIDDETATGIFNGKIRIKIAAPLRNSPLELVGRCVNVVRRQLRRLLLSSTHGYLAFQRVRGRGFTRADILKIRSVELPIGPSDAYAGLATMVMQPVTLDSDTVIMSGGLDWDFKDLHAIWKLKQEYGFQYCAVVYDLIPTLFPHFLVPGYIELLTEYFGELYWLADRAMCISDSTRRDWMNFCDAIGAQQVPSHVFPLGCDLRKPTDEQARPDLPPALIDKQYALFVSTIEPRKNHRLLYEAWDDCVRRKLINVDRDRLVFVGRRGWGMDDFLREMSLNPATRKTIIVLNNVDDAQLELIYRNCAFVLFPSQYEGFGLPVAEALGHGRPCISSDAGALPEIGGDLVVRLNPKDMPAWARAIAHYMRSPDELRVWAERVQKGYHPITWDMAAQKFFGTVMETAR